MIALSAWTRIGKANDGVVGVRARERIPYGGPKNTGCSLGKTVAIENSWAELACFFSSPVTTIFISPNKDHLWTIRRVR